MRRLLIVSALIAGTLSAQEKASSSSDLIILSEKLQAAIASEDWKQAIELSSALKKATEFARDQGLANGNGSLISQVLNWLPLDTETLAVSSVVLPLPRQQSRGKNQEPSLTATGYLLGMLTSLENGGVLKRFDGQTVSLSILAARHFQNHEAGPNGELPLGRIAYQGCGFYIFTGTVPETFLSALPASIIAGRTTWTATGEEYESARDAPPSDDTHFLALLKPYLLAVCNDREFYTTVVSRFSKTKDIRALPESLPEWKHVDRSAPFWAIRHYQPKRAAVDPTMSDPVEFQAGSIGLSFQIGVPKDTLRLTFLGKVAKDPFAQMEEDEQFAGFRHAQVGPGISRLSATGSELADPMFVFFAMGMLGFAILL